MFSMQSGTSHAVALNLPLTVYPSVRGEEGGERREREQNTVLF